MSSKRVLDYKPPILGSIVSRIARGMFWLAKFLPGGRALVETQGTQVPIDFQRWFCQRILCINSGAYWPMHPSSVVSYARRIRIGIETSPGWSPGCYIHGINGIYIGDYTQIAPNVGIISGNHDPYDLSRQLPARPIRIGKYCLLGMGSIILPEVELGDYTIVGANAVVTRSFPEGFVVLAGAPAKVVKRLDPSQRKDYEATYKYYGYVPAEKFAAFEKKHLRLR